MPKLEAPDEGIVVRMYRQGHGDCFLLALPRRDGGDPVYVLIDCGVKPGSQEFVNNTPIGDIAKSIAEATGNRLDLVVITHEHQDHLNGFWKEVEPYFTGFTIVEAWLAWTEDPGDPLANELRERHRDQLLSLLSARNKLANALGADDLAVHRIDRLLNLELGGEDDAFATNARLAAANPEASVNKQALKFIKDKASAHRGVRYLDPGGEPLKIPGSAVRVFVLGPPRDPNLLRDEDPKGSEAFPDDNPARHTFAAAAGSTGSGAPPFSQRFVIGLDQALSNEGDPFFRDHYGLGNKGNDDRDRKEVSFNAPWRRIGDDWLYSAEMLALKLNTGVNNTSLVLAFELPDSKKVLLFTGDAQRGNWNSWNTVTWRDGAQTVTARDLLGRTVLYKVSHHGSHNGTLKGNPSDAYANLSWMATGAAAGEFTAMITAVNEWALTKNHPPWAHPLPSIKRELMRKAQGRVFQTDTGKLEKPATVPDPVWKSFLKRCACEDLYFDYTIPDS
ncbi:MAG: hypothetical protein H0V37_10765 [Chloroflexia bacterium]|nr:hypothetical protein [Chloroflexia bacterium]